MNFQEAIQSVLSKYATFNGRASRSEYWWYFLFTVIVSIILGAISDTLSNIFNLAVFLPGLAVLVRRLHDVGKSGWYALLFYMPFVLLTAYFIYIMSKVDLKAFEANDTEALKNALADSSPGLLAILGLLCIVSVIYMLVLLCRAGDDGTNAYGVNPLTGGDIDEIESIGNNN